MELIAVKILIGGVTGLLHYRLGNVDLLGGSILATLAGSFLGTCVPVLWLRRLCTIRLATDTRILWAPAIH
jgi:hypothetical protein